MVCNEPIKSVKYYHYIGCHMIIQLLTRKHTIWSDIHCKNYRCDKESDASTTHVWKQTNPSTVNKKTKGQNSEKKRSAPKFLSKQRSTKWGDSAVKAEWKRPSSYKSWKHKIVGIYSIVEQELCHKILAFAYLVGKSMWLTDFKAKQS